MGLRKNTGYGKHVEKLVECRGKEMENPVGTGVLDGTIFQQN